MQLRELTRQSAKSIAVAGLILASGAASASSLMPDLVTQFGPTLRITEIETPLPPGAPYNIAPPVVIDGAVHVVDQFGEIVRRQAGGTYSTILDLSDASQVPTGMTPAGARSILGIADGPGDSVYVAFTSSTLPSGFTIDRPMPDTPSYSTPERPPHYQLIYRYSQDANGNLIDPISPTAPEAIAAFETTRTGHDGGGLLVFDTGDVLFATGDALNPDVDGLSAPQDNAFDLGKILLIDGETKEVTVAAKGVRNVQRLTFTDDSKTRIAFSDIGASTAEEINTITVADLIDQTETENFGWGRAPDGRAREGSFYITDGTVSTPDWPAPTDLIDLPEDGFRSPFAQFGREDLAFVAVTGPVSSSSSFETLSAVFGDLASGKVYGTKDAFGSGDLVEVFLLNLIDGSGDPITLSALAGGRPDPRFFTFADGRAGVLLERTGTIYAINEVAAVPVPLGLTTLASCFLLLGALAFRKGRRSATS